MTASMALAMLDKPVKERLRIAHQQKIYPLFIAREWVLEDEERQRLEEIFYAFYETPEYQGAGRGAHKENARGHATQVRRGPDSKPSSTRL